MHSNAAKSAAKRLRSRAIEARVIECDGTFAVQLRTQLEGFHSIALRPEECAGASAIFSMIAARLAKIARQQS